MHIVNPLTKLSFKILRKRTPKKVHITHLGFLSFVKYRYAILHTLLFLLSLLVVHLP